MEVWILFSECDGYGAGGYIEAVFSTEEAAREYNESKGFTDYSWGRRYRYEMEKWEVVDGNVHST